MNGDAALNGSVPSYPQCREAADSALALNITVPDGVEATASNGNVTLTGTVRYGTERTAAEQAVTYLTGVRNLRDDIA